MTALEAGISGVDANRALHSRQVLIPPPNSPLDVLFLTV